MKMVGFTLLVFLSFLSQSIQGQAAEGDLRLVDIDGSDGGDKGRLEVYWASQWGTVCEEGFDGQDARVACRQLGFTDYLQYDIVGNLGFPEGTFTWLEGLGCSGPEPRLIDCTHPGFGFEDCSNSQDIALVCSAALAVDDRPLTEGDIRLVGVEGLTRGIAGRVEVYYDSQWHTVLTIGTPGILEQNAKVVCNQLGLPSVVFYGTVRELGYTDGSISSPLLVNLACDGSEGRLVDCSFTTSIDLHSNDFAVLCGGTLQRDQPLNGQLRLSTESTKRPYSGRLEVYYDGQWGTVCDDGFTHIEAGVACRQLGFKSELFYGTVGDLGFGRGSGPIFLDNLGCNSEPAQELVDCAEESVGVHDCAHHEDIALVCLGVGSLRLTTNIGGSTSASLSSGRLEVYAQGTWGTVCDDSFEQVDADVACQQLGFAYSNSFDNVDDAEDFDISLPTLLDNVACTDSDTLLILCDHRGIGVENCFHSEDIALSCSTLSRDAVIALAVCVPIGLITLCIVACCVCCYICYAKTKPGKVSSNQNRTFQARAAYPTQYPAQSAPQAAYGYPPQQTYSAGPTTSSYPMIAYPSAPQQPPAANPMSQPPPAPYPSVPAPGTADPSVYSEKPPPYM